jgi:hypothetical protein
MDKQVSDIISHSVQRPIDIALNRLLSCDFISLFEAVPRRGASGQSSQFLRVYL